MNHECPKCAEQWYADGEPGQERCPNCGFDDAPAPCTKQKDHR